MFCKLQGLFRAVKITVAVILYFFVVASPKILFSQTDSLLLESLLNKRILTDEECTMIKKESAEIPVVISENTPINISAKLQTQFNYLDVKCDGGLLEGASNSNANIIPRRMILTFATDKSLDWGAQLSFDFVLSNKLSITYIRRKIDKSFLNGEIRMGYIKPNFCKEENMPIANLFCTERSIATYYWGGPRNARRLGFGSFMTGAYWFGNSVSIKGLKYAFGVSNSENYKLGFEQIGNGGTNNSPNIWLSSSYDWKFEDVKITFGLNLGYGADANKIAADAIDEARTASIWGANPYIFAEADNARMLAEFLVSGVDDGAKRGIAYEQSFPMGLNLNFEYKFDAGEIGKIAPVFRFTYLNTDGHGVLPSDGLRRCRNILGVPSFNEAQGYYFGLNWYLIGNTVKVQFGYEYAEFSGNVGTAKLLNKAHANTFRTQFQILF